MIRAKCYPHQPVDAVARRTKQDALATREALLDAAERMFEQRGVSRTSLNDIAQAAGVQFERRGHASCAVASAASARAWAGLSFRQGM